MKYVWFGFLFVLLGCSSESVPQRPFATAPIHISPATPLQVGQPLTLTLSTETTDTPINITLFTSYGAYVYTSNSNTITIPATDLQKSGLIRVVAQTSSAHGEWEGELMPDAPIEPLVPLVGARSIVADGEHWAMVVAVPIDSFGNPIAPQTDIEITLRRPSGQLEQSTMQTEHLLAWQRIWSQTKAGRTQIALQSEGQSGVERDLFEVAGWPVPFTLERTAPNTSADGRSWVTVQTSQLVDKHQNQLPDGTHVSFMVQSETLPPRFLTASTIDGIAEAVIEAPQTEGSLTIQAFVGTVASQTYTLTFAPNVGSSRFQVVTRQTEDEIIIEAGPILGDLQQYVPDGTPVLFELLGQSVQAEVKLGYATAVLRRRPLPAGTYNVQVTVGDQSANGRFTIEEE